MHRAINTDRDVQDDQGRLIKPEYEDNVGDCHAEEDMQGTEQEDSPHTDVDDTVETAAAAESDDTVRQNALLKEIEEQCVSHGRHPGEWDNVQLTWLQPVRSQRFVTSMKTPLTQ